MDISDLISLMALAISVVGGVFNYYYTKRSFEASNYPDLFIGGFKADSHLSVERELALDAARQIGLQVDPEDYFIRAASQESSIRFSLRNQSDSIAVTEVTVKLYLVRSFLFFKNFYKIYMKRVERLGPSQTTEIVFHGAQRPISKHVPGLYEQVGNIWLLKASQGLNLRVAVKYKPAIRRSHFVTLIKRYVVTPKSNNPYDAVWDVEEK